MTLFGFHPFLNTQTKTLNLHFLEGRRTPKVKAMSGGRRRLFGAPKKYTNWPLEGFFSTTLYFFGWNILMPFLKTELWKASERAKRGDENGSRQGTHKLFPEWMGIWKKWKNKWAAAKTREEEEEWRWKGRWENESSQFLLQKKINCQHILQRKHYLFLNYTAEKGR